MGPTSLRRPPAPSAAERARSLVARGGTASLLGVHAPMTQPRVHHVWADGSAVLLVPDGDPVLAAVSDAVEAGTAGDSAMLELADPAPVALREPVRGLLWVIGTLTRPGDDMARRWVARVADVRPDPALLDIGHGLTLLLLEPGSIVVADGDGTAPLSPVELAAARADPFCLFETAWLAHLDDDHPEVWQALAAHLPRSLRDRRPRPLGVDRCGLRLRVETPSGDQDVRLAWGRDVRTPAELCAALDEKINGRPSAFLRH
ncbi:MAG TPA: DUF2470 domain-containing protein [Pseudonocardia sp.]